MGRLALAVLLLGGCSLLEVDEPCGVNQVIDEDRDVCTCVEGAILTGGRCVPCPEGEEVAANQCVCPEGFIRNSGGVCEVSQAGAACSATVACDEPFPHCEIDAAKPGDSGYLLGP